MMVHSDELRFRRYSTDFNLNFMKNISFCLFVLSLVIEVSAQEGGYESLYHENGSNSAYCIKPTSDGGYIMTGFSNPTYSFFGQNVMLFKIDGQGNFEWSMNYQASQGGDYGNCVIETFDNNYAIVSQASTPSSFDGNAWLIITDNNGNMINSRFFGSPTTGDRFHGITQLVSDSSIVAVGKKGNEPFLVRTDKYGDSIITKSYTHLTATFRAVTSSPNGQFLYLVGRSATPEASVVLKTDLLGNIIWEQIINDDLAEDSYTALLVGDTLYFTGRIIGPTFNNISVHFLRAINVEDNSVVFTQTYGPNNSYPFKALIQGDGTNLVMVGTKSFGVGVGTAVYVVKTDAEGEIIWERHFGSNHSTNVLGWGICRAHDYGYMVCGQVVADGVPYVYIIKIDENGSTVGVNYIPIMPEISIYPNPCSEQLNISLGNHEGDKQLTIFNSAGQQVWQESTTAQELQINAVSQWQAGVYLVHIELVGHKIVRKIVVE